MTAENKSAAEQATTESKTTEKKSFLEEVFPNVESPEDEKPKKAPNNSSRLISTTLLVIMTICSVTALGLSIYNYLNPRSNTITLPGSGVDGNTATFVEGSISEVAAAVSPAVVSITTKTRTLGFFGQSQTSSAAGTGMIVSADGYIITNKHVIDGASNIEVIRDNGTTYDDINLVGTDPTNDVAYLKINNVSDLPTVTLGDSKTITVGQQVLTIGNALGVFQNTVADGIISGVGRSLTATDESYMNSETLSDMIQTTAAINAGNSGGPLINAAGQVIGINTATSSTGSNLGFAIPISAVKGMLNNIMKNNKAERAFLGASYISITSDAVKEYDLPVSAGAYIYAGNNSSAVVKDSPAAKASLKDKDIITKINGYEVGKAGTVSSLIGEYTVGDTVQLTILRDGKEQTLTATLAAYPTSRNNN
ncbi:MAG: trypsin-like peptidase domain-containing protein [Candidatus Saccharibacteria bacterium]|nr:trypsin-like peptidase domain-containing protein [Candidatus Saccharibacteria bacterium]